MKHGLQEEKELQRKTRAQVLKAFNWTKESEDKGAGAKSV
jgi:hypothetical protein